jgi:epsilon-lactone hydrolase
MASKAFMEHKKQFQQGPLPQEFDMELIPEKYRNLGVPVLPPDPGYEAKVPEGYEGGEVEIKGVKGLQVKKAGLSEKVAHMHIHGGGFTIGTAMKNGDLLAHFSEKTNLPGYSVEYRMGPYYKHPAALEDCENFYLGLLEQGYEQVVVGGESAGAALTLSLVHDLKAKGLPLPPVIWCSSPPVDQDYDHEEIFKPDGLLDSAEAIRQVYFAGSNMKDPLVSPIYGDLSGFPPMVIQAGEDESLAAGIVRFVERACRAGNEVHFTFGKEMLHTFAIDYEIYPEAAYAMDEITNFINHCLKLQGE